MCDYEMIEMKIMTLFTAHIFNDFYTFQHNKKSNFFRTFSKLINFFPN